MTQQTLIAIGTMLNAFPASQGDVDVLVRSFDAATADIAPQAVCEAAARFMSGKVNGHNPRFAPTVAEFAVHARQVAEWQEAARAAASRPRIAAAEYPRHDTPPFKIREGQMAEKYRNWTTIREGVSYDEYWRMRRAREIPHNATWVHALNGRVCTPPEAME